MVAGYMGGFFNDSNYVYVDPHVLASPTLADVNNDGNVEIIIPVSYYFDREEHPGNVYTIDTYACIKLPRNSIWYCNFALLKLKYS